MKIEDGEKEKMKLGGTLRGANMGILNFDHPDIEEFITVKSDPNALTNFNVSVAITDKFIRAVKNDGEYSLISPRTGKPVKKESAKRIFDMISQQAWDNGINLWDAGSAPPGGNHWSDFDTVGEGCYDYNNNGFCDDIYLIPGGVNKDNYPVSY